MRTVESWIERYKEKNALWIHDGNPLRPHALLTSGKHSNGFFNSRLVIPDEPLLRLAASDLFGALAMKGARIKNLNGVVGPQTGATKLAEMLKYEVIRSTGRSCFSASPAKSEVDGTKSMVFGDEDICLFPGKWVLLCEDVVTTGGSVDLTETAVTNAGGRVLPFVLCLVNRSGLKEANGKQIVSLIDCPMPTWTPEDCKEHHLCSLGSEAIRPKGPPEWARLNATY